MGLCNIGLVFTIVDLFEMKCTTTLHCSIHGSMDCTNLRFIGARTHSSYKPTKRPVHTSTTASDLVTNDDAEAHDAIIIVLDYFPDPVTSYFFTIRLSGASFDDINMDYSEPLHINSTSPLCTVLLPEGRCVTGQTNGALLMWDGASQRRLDNLYDRQLYGEMKTQGRSGRPAHAGSVTSLTLGNDVSVLVSGGMDGFVKLWHISKKILLRSVNFESPVNACIRKRFVTLKLPSLLYSFSSDTSRVAKQRQQPVARSDE